MAAFVPASGSSPPKEEKPRQPKSSAVLGEPERLIAHRVLGLLDLGFTVEQTLEICTRVDIVHDAEALLKRGWPLAFVYEELT